MPAKMVIGECDPTNARVETHHDGVTVQGYIMSIVSSAPLVKLQLDNGQVVARHRDRITPLNSLAKILLGKE